MKVNDKYINTLDETHIKSFLEYKRGIYHTEEWGSHQPVLIHLLNTIIDGDVIEVGMGYNSTPLMNHICKKQNRNLLSVEFNKSWYDKFKIYKSETHKLQHLDEKIFKNNNYNIFNKKYSIGFIDSGPMWTRFHALKLLKDNTDYIICHDAGNGNEITSGYYGEMMYKYNKEILDKNVIFFKKVRRHTLLIYKGELINKIKQIF